MEFGRIFLSILPLSMALAGCMVGPNFHSPKAPPVSSYTANALPANTAHEKAAGQGGKTQYFVTRQDIPAQWWTLFHSPVINELVITGMNHSPSLDVAYAALRNAQETMNAQIGNTLFPAFSANVGGERELFSGAPFGGGLPSNATVFNVFNANVNVAYTFDVFGGARRQIESLYAQVDYQQFQLIAAYLTLSANIVTTAVTVAAYTEQIKATEALIAAQANQLDMIKKQFNLGGASQGNVLTQQTLFEQTRATLPPLQKNLAQAQHALAVLVGDFPNRHLPEINLAAIALPQKLPVSLPSRLVRQRPDVRASEALMHAAMAKVGVATANLFPQFTLTGTYGWQASTPSTLFGTTSNTWFVLGSITQPIFQGGALRAQRRAAIAAYEQSVAMYKQTVLQAFQNVADTLRALETDARALRAQKEAEIAAKRSLRITQKQYQLGGVSYLEVLTAQQQYQQAVIARIQAQASRYNDTAALFQALGGGWWNKEWCTKECLVEHHYPA